MIQMNLFTKQKQTYRHRKQTYGLRGACQVALVVKNLPVNAGDIRDAGLIPGSRRSPGGGHGNLLQYCCLENLTDREHWLATVHRVIESQTRLKQLSMHTFVYLATPHLSCGTWDLQSSLQHVGSSSLTRNQTSVPPLGVWSLNHWTTREVPSPSVSLHCLPSMCLSISKFPLYIRFGLGSMLMTSF